MDQEDTEAQDTVDHSEDQEDMEAQDTEVLSEDQEDTEAQDMVVQDTVVDTTVVHGDMVMASSGSTCPKRTDSKKLSRDLWDLTKTMTKSWVRMSQFR